MYTFLTKTEPMMHEIRIRILTETEPIMSEITIRVPTETDPITTSSTTENPIDNPDGPLTSNFSTETEPIATSSTTETPIDNPDGPLTSNFSTETEPIATSSTTETPIDNPDGPLTSNFSTETEPIATSPTNEIPIAPPRVEEGNERRPRPLYSSLLYQHAIKRDWDKSNGIFGQYGISDALKAELNSRCETILHIAVGIGKNDSYVTKLVDMIMKEADPSTILSLKDIDGCNALHIAALTGNIHAAELLVQKSRVCHESHDNHIFLYAVKNNNGKLPIQLAATCGHRKLFEYLQSEETVLENLRNSLEGVLLLNDIIEAGFIDLALKLVDKYPQFAITTTLHRTDFPSALQTIAAKQTEFKFQSKVGIEFWQRFSSYYSGRGDSIDDVNHKMTDPEKLVNKICTHMKNQSREEYDNVLGYAAQAMVTATTLNIPYVVKIIVEEFPDAIYSCWYSTNRRSIFHHAIRHRSEKVYNLVYQMSYSHRLLNQSDSEENTILHMAALLPHPNKLNIVSGAALQLQREIQWFKEVENIVHPFIKNQQKNNDGMTAKMLFTEKHAQLKVDGEKWMKDTATSCSIVAVLIATVIFAAAITVPGGTKSNNGFPMFLGDVAFIIFSLSDAVSMFASTTSLLMFLSILTSRYAEEDFLYALPSRLCTGLVTLFLSILFMIIAFSAAVVLVFGHHRLFWVAPTVGVLALFPVISFLYQQSPLVLRVLSSTYGCPIFGKQSNKQFY